MTRLVKIDNLPVPQTLVDGENLSRLAGDIVIVSDVHLRSLDDERGQVLLQCLRDLDKSTCQYLVLNGDIFDFCLGGSDFYLQKFSDLGTVLDEIAAAGVRVIFLEGNHEFHMDQMEWPRVSFVSGGDYPVTLENGLRIKIAHGDLVKFDPWYYRFRALVKSSFVHFFAKLFPQKLLDTLCIRYAGHSRSQDQYRTLDEKALTRTLSSWIDEGKFDIGIVGHFHVEIGRKTVSGKNIYCVDSWAKPNFLVGRKGEFFRYYPGSEVDKGELLAIECGEP